MAMQDVMEMNFGFQVESIAGVSVEQVKKEKEAEEGTSQNAEIGKEEKKEGAESGSGS